MNIKTQQLNELFIQWQKDFTFSKDDFHADGIINEELYEQNPPGKKILFIAKEPNAINHKENKDRSFVTEWNGERAPTYPFALRIAEWACGITEGFISVYDELADKKMACLKRIAFMNMKKSGGKGLADNKEIYEVVEKQKELIKKEINIIEPDIILLCVSFDKQLIRDVFGELAFVRSGYGVEICKHKNSKVINFYHPSSRNVGPAAYSLLQNVVRSEAFKNI